MKKLLAGALLATSFALAACGDSYQEREDAEAYDEQAADTTYAEPAPTDTTTTSEPDGADTPAPEPADTTTPEPAPAAPDDY